MNTFSHNQKPFAKKISPNQSQNNFENNEENKIVSKLLTMRKIGLLYIWPSITVKAVMKDRT